MVRSGLYSKALCSGDRATIKQVAGDHKNLQLVEATFIRDQPNWRTDCGDPSLCPSRRCAGIHEVDVVRDVHGESFPKVGPVRRCRIE